MLPSAQAHDLPASVHPATREAEQIEALLSSQPAGTLSNPKLFSFIATRLIWQPSTLAVCFWNGGQAERAKIAGIANEVAALTPVHFSWGNPASITTCPAIGYQAFPVRVSLNADPSLLVQGDNSSDYFTSVGRTIATTPRKASVNLPFPADASDGLYREKTLHEFCHVLGCLHEHQRGLCDKDFNKPWIEAHYGYNDQQYADNFLNIPSSSAFYGTAFSAFDSQSIMLYSILPDAFSNKSSPCYRAAPVSSLSSDDRDGLRRAYATTRDPQLKTVDDFVRLTALYDAVAQSKRAEAFALHITAGDWTKNTPLLPNANRLQALHAFDAMAAQADDQSTAAQQRADSYRLTPDTMAKLKAVMAMLPPE